MTIKIQPQEYLEKYL